MLSGEKRDILFSLKLPNINNDENNFEVCKVKLSYLNVIEMNNETKDLYCSIKRLSTLSSDFSVSIELDKQRNRIITTDALEKARKMADENKLDEAKTTLLKTIETIQKNPLLKI